MKLREFQVTKFRNVVDSGSIVVDASVTCFVGKNEAGKSGILEALYLLHPSYDEKFDEEQHYPRWLAVKDRKQNKLGEHAPISATFELDSEDTAAIAALVGAATLTQRTVKATRKYNDELRFEFDCNECAAVEHILRDTTDEVRNKLRNAKTLQAVRDAAAGDEEDANALTSDEKQLLTKVLEQSGLAAISVHEQISSLLSKRLPVLFRFTNYSTLPGRIDFKELAKGNADGPASTNLQAARALLKLAGTDTNQLGRDDYELRKGELEAVQIELTNQVFEYWKQNESLEVLIDVDKATVSAPGGGHQAVSRFLDIRLKDKRTGYSNNFSQRSSGFQWFFSFLAAFSEFENRSAPIVLLDEPALTLHGKAQGDFLRFINERLSPNSPVLYTTHSPFMIEPDKLERVRIVEDHGPPRGATCTSDVLTSDPSSLFPLQAALGYDIAQTLFVGPNNLVVEGTSDFIYLTTLSRACANSGRISLDDRWRILPAGGASNIPTFVSLVGPHLDVTVLADSDTQGLQRLRQMSHQKLLSAQRLIFANVATGSNDADLEDVFEEADYLEFYNRTFGTRLVATDLPHGTRIVKRIEAKTGKFNHGEVAEWLLRNHSTYEFAPASLDRFSLLFLAINKTLGT